MYYHLSAYNESLKFAVLAGPLFDILDRKAEFNNVIKSIRLMCPVWPLYHTCLFSGSDQQVHRASQKHAHERRRSEFQVP